MNKIFFERDWGFLAGEVSKNKFDFFPRLTVIAAKYMFEIIIGFCCFRLWLTIHSKEIQEFNRKNREAIGQ